jgi:hypothetical protein
VVRSGDGVAAFTAAVRDALAEPPGPRRERAEPLLAAMSWDATWAAMLDEIELAVLRRTRLRRPMAATVPRPTLPTPPPGLRTTRPIHFAAK